MHSPVHLMIIFVLLIITTGDGVAAKWTTRRPYVKWPVGIGAPEATSSSFSVSVEFDGAGQVNGATDHTVDSTARFQPDGSYTLPTMLFCRM